MVGHLACETVRHSLYSPRTSGIVPYSNIGQANCSTPASLCSIAGPMPFTPVLFTRMPANTGTSTAMT
jgi:hypothetical protein